MSRLKNLLGNVWNGSEEDVTAFAQWLLSSFLDATFLAVWIPLQSIPTIVLDKFPLSGIEDTIQLGMLKWIFAITTLIPIIAHFVKNSAILLIQSWRAVANEHNGTAKKARRK